MHNGFSACLYVTFCGCFALRDAIDNVGGQGSCLYCWASVCPETACCALMSASEIVAAKVGIQEANHCVLSCCDALICHTCAVYDESCKYKAGVYKKADAMERE